MKIAVVGASGLVGRKILKLAKIAFPSGKFFCYCSKKSAGKVVCGEKLKELNIKNIAKVDFCFFSAGAEVSRQWAGEFVKMGAVVIDNSSAFRRKKNVPLVVPELNICTAKSSKLIANPNCSTIGLALPLAQIIKVAKVKSVYVCTYQSASGAGQAGLDDLENGTTNKLPYPLKNNVIPFIGKFSASGKCEEEDKMEFEIKKILGINKIDIFASCARVPTSFCHCEFAYVKLKHKANLEKIKEALKNASGVCYVKDDINSLLPSSATNKTQVFVGRLRKCDAKTISFYLVFDNLLKGAASNAVQIATLLNN